MLWKKSPSHFEEIYQENHRFIRTVVYWCVRSDGVEDIVQETFIKAWKNRENFKGNSQIRTWLYRIAMNCCYDYLKKNQPMGQGEDVDTLPVESSDDLEVKQIIDLGLSKMSGEQRESFVLFYKMGLTQKEIAELREIPEGTVKSQLFSAREIFSKVMEKEGVTCEG